MTPYLVFWQGKRPADVVYGDPTNAQPGDIWVLFVSQNGDTVAQHYDYDVNHNQIYSPPPPPAPPPPQPNPLQFFALVHADTTITDAEKGILAQLFGSLMALLQAGQPGAVKSVWSNTIAAYGPTGSFGTWLTVSMQAVIQNYAVESNIALV